MHKAGESEIDPNGKLIANMCRRVVGGQGERQGGLVVMQDLDGFLLTCTQMQVRIVNVLFISAFFVLVPGLWICVRMSPRRNR